VKTIGIDLWAGQLRGKGPNSATCYHDASRPRGVVRPLRELFIGAYNHFADLCRDVDEPGVGLLAIDERTGIPAGLVRLRARVGRHVAAVVGRHDACDLFLDKHSSLSLRHLAVVLEPVSSWAKGNTRVSYRVLDLRTETGFTDEHGKHMRGLRAEGPAIMRVAGYAIFIMPLGDPSDWPHSGGSVDAWDMLPERVYFDEMQSRPDGSLVSMPVDIADVRKRQTLVFRTHGPRETGQGLVMRGDVAGTLELIGDRRYGRLEIGDQALRDGVLLGRYARCDGAAMLEDAGMSRVHALLLQTNDALLVIDTASRNGTFQTGQPAARVITVTRDTEINLGKHTRIRWHWAD
jgi:hypothetical protein